MALPRQKVSARETILAAAASVAREHGVLGLSIDRIIEVAAVSKGGFFYHFASKDSLVEAVVTSELDRFESIVDTHMQRGLTYAESFVETMLEFVAANGQMLGSVTAALASGGAIKSLVVRRHDGWFKRLRKELTREKYTLLSLAADGLVFSCTLRDAPPTRAEQLLTRRVLREIVA